MRKVLLLVALAMLGVLVLSTPAMAQSASASADPCPDPDFPRETPDGCQASDLPDVTFSSATPTVGTPMATVSATASATASASASPLPETGGPDLAGAMALPMLALLVAGGIFAARLVRR